MSWQWDFFLSTILQAAHAKDEMSKGKDNAVISKDNRHLKREEKSKRCNKNLRRKISLQLSGIHGMSPFPVASVVLWIKEMCLHRALPVIR